MKIPFLSGKTHNRMREQPNMPPDLHPVSAVRSYHEETKHHYDRFARSTGYLDWNNQPNPFRRFRNAPETSLPILEVLSKPLYDEIFRPQHIEPQPLNLSNLSHFLRNSLAISAWKRYENSRWALRVNPSSGNLHPTEGYLLLADTIPEMQSGVYHYAPQNHLLEQRTALSEEMVGCLFGGFPENTFLTGLSTIPWREAWKYGERAYRYCQHDLGHALAALRISAAVLGWRFVLLDELSHRDIARLLGLTRQTDFAEAEPEYPSLLAAVLTAPAAELSESTRISEEAISMIEQRGVWNGTANRLSEEHVEWEIIDAVSRYAFKPSTDLVVRDVSHSSPLSDDSFRFAPAATLIQQRRSALALDGETGISISTFCRMLTRTLPYQSPIPFDALVRSPMADPHVHLAVFVLRIQDLQPGLYLLARNGTLEHLQTAMHQDFLWQKPTQVPRDLPFYLLREGDFRGIASDVSCTQAIAGTGAFSLGMIAEFEEPLEQIGAWYYPRLFWECGIIGQILYLEAEAAGIRATGIGCFFDDPMHDILGLRDRHYQSLYHFTMGGPVEDTRLTTEPPYPNTR